MLILSLYNEVKTILNISTLYIMNHCINSVLIVCLARRILVLTLKYHIKLEDMDSGTV